jgi:hypothetical protein
MAPETRRVGALRLVAISGWAKHAILEEIISLETA